MAYMSIVDSGKPLLVTSRKLELYRLESGEYAVSRQIISVLTKLPNGYISKILNGSKSTRKYLSRGGWVKVLPVLSFLDEFRRDLPDEIARMGGFEFVEFIFSYRHSVIQLKDECHNESIDLLELWQQIVANIEEIPARAICASNCSIVELNGKAIRIGVHQKSSFNLVKQRAPQLGKACAKTLKCGVKLSLVVIEGKPPPVPSAPPPPPPPPVPKPVVTTARSGETFVSDIMSRTTKTARSGETDARDIMSRASKTTGRSAKKPTPAPVLPIAIVEPDLNENPLPYKDEVTVRRNKKGEWITYLTIRAAARVLGIDDENLSRVSRGADLAPKKLLEMLAEKGFKGADLAKFAKEGIPDIAFGEMVEYYALYAGRYCTEKSRKLMSFFKTAGIRSSFLMVANVQPIQPDRDRLEARIILKQETHHVLTSAIKRHLNSIGRYDSKSHSTSRYFAKILDLVNVLLTGETSRQMIDRLSEEKGSMVTASDAIRDWFDTSLIMKYDRLCYCAAGLIDDGIEPEIAVKQAFVKFLPGHIVAKPKFVKSKTDVKLLESC